MTNDEFKKLRQELNTICTKTLSEKEEEYSFEKDRLIQFKAGGALDPTGPILTLTGMMKKHTTSIYDMAFDHATGKVYTKVQWLEKIKDHRNYLDLLWALLHDVDAFKK